MGGIKEHNVRYLSGCRRNEFGIQITASCPSRHGLTQLFASGQYPDCLHHETQLIIRNHSTVMDFKQLLNPQPLGPAEQVVLLYQQLVEVPAIIPRRQYMPIPVHIFGSTLRAVGIQMFGTKTTPQVTHRFCRQSIGQYRLSQSLGYPMDRLPFDQLLLWRHQHFDSAARS